MKSKSIVAMASLAMAFTSAAVHAQAPAGAAQPRAVPAGTPQQHPYLGMWVTPDGHIRHELLANGRYDEQRGSRKSAYQGRYWVRGNRIEYVDDTGFTADGEFRDGVFHHGGYVFRRQN